MNNLEQLNGIGPKTKEQFQKIGINTIEDLLYYYPRKYQIIKKSDIKNITENDKIIIDGKIDSQPIIIPIKHKAKKMVIFRLATENRLFNISIFNQVYLCQKLKIGMNITIIGKYSKQNNTINVSEIRLGLLPPQPKIEAIYPATSDLNQKTITKFINLALKTDVQVIDYIPKQLIKKYKFPEKRWSITEIHHPTNSLSYKKALQRLKYEELFNYLYKIQNIKKKRMQEEHGQEKKFNLEKVSKFIKTLPFTLTKDQIKTVDEIAKDIQSKTRMNRLVQGDVGSGKTIVAFIASYMNYLSKYQSALMVPTEILATQHYQNAIELFKKTNMKIALLTSNIPKKEKNKIYSEIESGEINFVIGTQSLIQENVKFHKLGLIITDEQHRFGVHQREELKNKGIFPDVLSMSATPIPRTYALTIYGDMDVSSIKTKPAGRKKVITYSKTMNEIPEVLSLMKKEIDLGHQIYVIAPTIENEEDSELKTIKSLEEKMNLALGKIAKIASVHGKLSPEEKKKTMDDFEKNKIKILISTTVIEVGVNVPNASTIVIFHANYFGLSTLHQLRGRVGRSDIQSYCILLSSEVQERLKILEKEYDGFKISEYDFQTRGEGDLFGYRQSGEANFKLADIRKDFELLLRAKEDVEKLT